MIETNKSYEELLKEIRNECKFYSRLTDEQKTNPSASSDKKTSNYDVSSLLEEGENNVYSDEGCRFMDEERKMKYEKNHAKGKKVEVILEQYEEDLERLREMIETSVKTINRLRRRIARFKWQTDIPPVKQTVLFQLKDHPELTFVGWNTGSEVMVGYHNRVRVEYELWVVARWVLLDEVVKELYEVR